MLFSNRWKSCKIITLIYLVAVIGWATGAGAAATPISYLNQFGCQWFLDDVDEFDFIAAEEETEKLAAIYQACTDPKLDDLNEVCFGPDVAEPCDMLKHDFLLRAIVKQCCDETHGLTTD